MNCASRDLGHVLISGNVFGLSAYRADSAESQPILCSDQNHFTWSSGGWNRDTKLDLAFITAEGCISFSGKQNPVNVACRKCGVFPYCQHVSRANTLEVLGEKALGMLLEIDRILSREAVDQLCAKRLTARDLALITTEFPFFLSLDPTYHNRFGRVGVAFAKAFRDVKASVRDQREKAKIERRLTKLFDELPLGTPLLSRWANQVGILDSARPNLRAKYTLFFETTPVAQGHWLGLSPEVRRSCRILTRDAAKALPTGQLSNHRLLELLARVDALDSKFAELFA